MFFVRSKRKRIIKKAVKKTVAEFLDRTPKIYQHFFYGAVEITDMGTPDITFCNGTKEEQDNIMHSLESKGSAFV